MNAAVTKWLSVFQTENKVSFNKTEHRRKKSWQTIEKKIRVVVRMLAADKASKADSKADSKVVSRVVSRVANKVEVKRAVSKAAANSIGETKWVRS
jgi:hypothetical protein